MSSILENNLIENEDQIQKPKPSVEESLRLIEDLKYFLATAPANWQNNQIIRRYYLNHEEGFVSCVMWNNLYFITGTDIVRCIVYRFELFGREILDRKKFEEGIFSDLRSLKCGNDAVLEPSKSPFLEFLYRNQCLRTQKKQKVFFWFSVPHDKLFADALERDIKKEQSDQIGTTKAISNPALSFVYDEQRNNLNEQILEYVNQQKEENPNTDDTLSTLNASTIPLSSSTNDDYDPDNSGSSGNHTYIIKEENNTPIISSDQFDDDFPLDYFPANHHEPLLIDPSVFFNPPDTFDDQLLIDQTYAKTPFKDTFDLRINGREEEINRNEQDNDDDNDDDEDSDSEQVPVSQIPNNYHIPPPITINGVPYENQPPYPFQHHYSQSQHITNGQYYDRQSNGESNEPSEYLNEYPPNAPPGYYTYASHPYAGANGPVPSAPQPIPVPYSYDGFYQQGPYYQPFKDEETDDGDDELYGTFERQQQYYHYLQQQPVVSPFGRFFPSFEATNPPSSKGLKFPKSISKHKITKSSTLRRSRSNNNMNNNNRTTAAAASRNLEKINEGKGSVKFKDHKEIVDNGKDIEIDNSNKEVERTGNEKIKEEESIGLGDEDEYNSLPTPESTAPHDHQFR